jgi:hypothetical protein
LVGLSVLLAACATTADRPKARLLSPAPQSLPINTVTGELIIAQLERVTVSLRALSWEALQRFYAAQRDLVNPFADLPAGNPGPTAFLLHLRNDSPDALSFDPTAARLADQEGRRKAPLDYPALYGTHAGLERGAERLQAIQRTTLTTTVIVPPGGERRGLLLFPELPADARAVLVDLASFYRGSAPQLLVFQFLVTEQP